MNAILCKYAYLSVIFFTFFECIILSAYFLKKTIVSIKEIIRYINKLE
jgi:hypothetical protein